MLKAELKREITTLWAKLQEVIDETPADTKSAHQAAS